MDKWTNTRFIVTTRTDNPKELHEFYARSGQNENWMTHGASFREPSDAHE